MPSLYEFTTPVGDVASGDFTTLYNASGLTVPNAGAGSVSGNLNVGGNLTVQGSSLLIGPVTLQSTLCLPNYCFPLPDGTTYQVLATDGSGNLYWTDVNTIPGSNYSIDASTTTGGANLNLTTTTTTDSVKFASGTGITVSRTDANTITITNNSPAGTTYTIDASATTGGANLNLVGSDSSTDSVKFAGGTNVTVTRTDANTVTISSTADDIPDGTAQGQLLVWNGTAWTANSTVTFAATANRTQFRGDLGQAGRVSTSALFVNDTGATNYGDNDGSGILIGVDSDSQSTVNFASINSAYFTSGNHQFRVNTSTNNFATDTATSITGGNTLVFGSAHGYSAGERITLITNDSNGLTNGTYYYVLATGLTATQCQVSLTSGGSAVALTNGTGLNLVFNTSARLIRADQDSIIFAGPNLTLNSIGSGVAAVDATITVERGSSGADATLAWSETNNRWQFSNDLFVSGNYSQNGESLGINADSTAADSNLYFKGSSQYLKWNNTDQQFEFSDTLFISQTDIPEYLERRVTMNQVNDYESATTLQLIERVTDAGSNATDDAGPGIMFARNYGSSGNTPFRFANIGANYFGTTNTAEFRFNWSSDNYLESPVNVYPGTYSLLRLGSDNSSFYNDSIFVDYSAASTTTNTATSITGSNTLVFGSAHGYTAGQRIQYTSTTQNGLTQNTYYYVLSTGLTTTQCQLGLSPTGSAISLTNGTGLTLVFANLINQIGINTTTPAYTLDVNGDAHVDTDLTVDGDIYVSGVHVNLSTPVHQGQFLYVSNDVTPTITNSANIIFTDTTYRPLFESNTGVYGRSQSAAGLRNNTLTNNFTTGDGTAILYSLESNAQSAVFFGSTGAVYDPAGDSTMNLSTSTNNFNYDLATSITGGNLLNFSAAHGFAIGDRLIYNSPSTNGLVYRTTYYVIAAGFTTTACQISLTQGGSAVALTNGTGLNLYFSNKIFRNLSVSTQQLQLEGNNLIFNAFNTGIAGGNATITVERGTSGTDSTITWNETSDRWEISDDVYAPQATIGNIDIDRTNGTITTNTGNLTLDSAGGTVNINDNLAVDTDVLYVDIANNRVGINTATPANALDVNGSINTNNTVYCADLEIDGISTFNTQTTTTTSTALTTISATTRTSQKVIINIIDNVSGEVHILEALALRKGVSAAYLTTYAEMYSNAALATFTADAVTISGSDYIRIRATPASTNSTTFNVTRISLD